jgi:hypothetical protein
VCQVHTAVAAVVQSWWLDNRASKQLYEQAAKEIARAQNRNAQARKSHTKTTRRKLRRLGIKLTEINRCIWNST